MVSPGRGRGDKKAEDTSSPADLTTTDGSDSVTSKDSGQPFNKDIDNKENINNTNRVSQ